MASPTYRGFFSGGFRPRRTSMRYDRAWKVKNEMPRGRWDGDAYLKKASNPRLKTRATANQPRPALPPPGAPISNPNA